MADPKRKKKTELISSTEEPAKKIRKIPHPIPDKRAKGEKVDAISVDFKIKEEAVNVYELEDGTVIRFRPCLMSIDKVVDPDTGEALCGEDKKPLYGLNISFQASTETPEGAVSKDKGEGKP